MIVDDEQGPRDSLRMILSPEHHVLQASSGIEAIECLRREPVDLMTLDLHMPGMNGQQLLRTVRNEFPQVEIVIITGCGSVESAAEGIRFGVCDYLQKPFDVVQVSAAVERALARQRARGRLTSFLEQLGEAVGREIRQLLSGRGRHMYRILFEVRADAVCIMRLRHTPQWDRIPHLLPLDAGRCAER